MNMSLLHALSHETDGAAIVIRDAIGIESLREHLPATRRRLRAEQHLYRAGQPFDALFVVHFGCLKVSDLSGDGREQVTGFRMRGDLVGAESIGLPGYACDVVALEDCEVWALPYRPIPAACLRLPSLQACLTAALAEEIRRDRSWMLTLGTLKAEQRVASFLLDLAARHARLGYSAHHFILRMSRADIASFLNLKHETVSRILSRLQERGQIAVDRREIRILDAARLAGVPPVLQQLATRCGPARTRPARAGVPHPHSGLAANR